MTQTWELKQHWQIQADENFLSVGILFPQAVQKNILIGNVFF